MRLVALGALILASFALLAACSDSDACADGCGEGRYCRRYRSMDGPSSSCAMLPAACMAEGANCSCFPADNPEADFCECEQASDGTFSVLCSYGG